MRLRLRASEDMQRCAESPPASESSRPPPPFRLGEPLVAASARVPRIFLTLSSFSPSSASTSMCRAALTRTPSAASDDCSRRGTARRAQENGAAGEGPMPLIRCWRLAVSATVAPSALPAAVATLLALALPSPARPNPSLTLGRGGGETRAVSSCPSSLPRSLPLGRAPPREGRTGVPSSLKARLPLRRCPSSSRQSSLVPDVRSFCACASSIRRP